MLQSYPTNPSPGRSLLTRQTPSLTCTGGNLFNFKTGTRRRELGFRLPWNWFRPGLHLPRPSPDPRISCTTALQRTSPSAFPTADPVSYRPRFSLFPADPVHARTPVSYTHLTLPTNREV